MNEFLTNLRKEAEENPVAALAAAASVIAALSQLVKAKSSHRNSVSWRREVRRREMKTAKK